MFREEITFVFDITAMQRNFTLVKFVFLYNALQFHTCISHNSSQALLPRIKTTNLKNRFNFERSKGNVILTWKKRPSSLVKLHECLQIVNED